MVIRLALEAINSWTIKYKMLLSLRMYICYHNVWARKYNVHRIWTPICLISDDTYLACVVCIVCIVCSIPGLMKDSTNDHCFGGDDAVPGLANETLEINGTHTK